MMKIGFLVSGNGGTLKFLYYAIKRLKLDYKIQFVIADRDCGAYKFALQKGIDTQIVTYNSSNRENLLKVLKIYNDVQLIITNIHKVIDNNILNLYQDKFINLHYSLLPAFSGMIGMDTVKEARKANVQFIGATCHYVTEILDGGNIIGQACFPVNWNAGDEFIVDSVFKTACNCLLNSILLIDRLYIKNTNMKVDEKTLYNPPLLFNVNEFDENFWELIKKS